MEILIASIAFIANIGIISMRILLKPTLFANGDKKEVCLQLLSLEKPLAKMSL